MIRKRLDPGLHEENDIELYSNAALTPWLETTLDLQIVDSAIEKRIDDSGNLKDVDTTVVLGLRVRARF